MEFFSISSWYHTLNYIYVFLWNSFLYQHGITHYIIYMYFYGILFYIIMVQVPHMKLYIYICISMEFFSISSTKASDHHWQTMAQFLPVRILKSFRCVCIAVSINELDNEIYDTKHALLSTLSPV